MQRFPSGEEIPGGSGAPRIMDVVSKRPGKEAPERKSRRYWPEVSHGREPGEKTYPQGMCCWAN